MIRLIEICYLRSNAVTRKAQNLSSPERCNSLLGDSSVV